jgi:flagellar hook assembly protein FlgD
MSDQVSALNLQVSKSWEPPKKIVDPRESFDTKSAVHEKSEIEKQNRPFNNYVFGDSETAHYQAAVRQQQMVQQNDDFELSEVQKDYNKELKTLMRMIAESTKDRDPTSKDDQDPMKMTEMMINVISAGGQLKQTKMTSEQNALLKQQHRISAENRIGMKVQYAGNFVEVQDVDTKIPFFYRLASEAHHGSLKIVDPKTGMVVRELQISQKEAGDHKLEWNLRNGKNGEKVPPALYGLHFEAFDKRGRPIDNLLETVGTVSEVDTASNGEPQYFIGGIPVNGPIKNVSSGTSEAEKVIRHLNTYFDETKRLKEARQVIDQRV